MKKTINISIALLVMIVLVACKDDRKPNYQYMPNMYEPVGYETYGEYDVFENGQAAKLPAEGTVPRGWQPYDYEDTTDGLNLAKAALENPIPVTEENLASGAQLYTVYCSVCHGEKGDGNGILMQREKILGIPSYAAPGRLINDGGTYHVMMYGLNSMGSYASQTNELERWQITHHVMNLKAALEGTPLRQTTKVDDGDDPQMVTLGLESASVTQEDSEQTN